MQDGDSRFSSYDFTPVIEAANKGRWPGRDQVFVLLGATFVDGPAPTAPTIRAIALAPDQFDNRSVTLVGPIQRAGTCTAICRRASRRANGISCCSRQMQPSGSRACAPKARTSTSMPSARVDTGRWLEVKGTVQRDAAATWLAGESLRLTAAPSETPVEVTGPPLPPEPPPMVIFSAPLADETDFPVGGRDQDSVFAGHERTELSRPRARSATAAPRLRPSHRRPLRSPTTTATAPSRFASRSRWRPSRSW